MKKIILFILLFCATKSFAQFPINAAQGTQTTTVLTRGISASDSGYWYRTAFADTTALNRGRIDEIAGVVARTSDNSLWLRNNTATRWIQLSGGSGSVNIYNSDGTQTGNRIVTGGGYTLAFDAQSSIRLQPSGSNRTSLLYMDIDSIRLEPPFGILTIDSLASGASTDSVLVWTQATGRVKKRSYSAFTPTWQQTLTAGSIITGNTITDNGGITWNGNSGIDFTVQSYGAVSMASNANEFLQVQAGESKVGVGSGTNSSRVMVEKDTLWLEPHTGVLYIDTLTNLSTQNTLLGWKQGTGQGQVGYVTLGSGLSLSSGILNTSGTVPTPISSLTAATGANSIDNGSNQQTWLWNNISGNTGLSLQSTSTAAFDKILFESLITGASAGNNIASEFVATGGANNYAIIVPASSGDVGIGTSTPTSKLHVVSTQTTGVGNQFSSSTTTSGSIMDITGTSTALAANNEGLNIGISGANATNGITATGARISVTNTNATSGTNVALDLTASGATTANYALITNGGNVGIGTSTPTSLAHINGVLQMGTAGATLGQILLSGNTSGTVTLKTAAAAGTWSLTLPTNDGDASQVLTTDGSGVTSWTTPSSGTVTGSGTTNYLSKWTSSTALGNSIISESGGNAGVTSAAGTSVQITGTNDNGYYCGFGQTGSSFASGEALNNYSIFGSYSGSGMLFFTDGNTGSGGSATMQWRVGGYAATQERMRLTTTGLGIGTSTPSAYLHLKAGTATASTAPLKLTTGTSLTTAEAGAFEYTTPQLFFTNGAAIRQEIPQIQQARVSTQYDNTTTTLGTVTGLTTNVAAGKTYRFEAVLYTTSDGSGGVKFAMAGTATATNIIYEAVVFNAGSMAAQTRATALATTVGAVTAVTNAYAKITGTITVNAAGTFLVQAAANAATGTTSVLVGSTFVITEML